MLLNLTEKLKLNKSLENLIEIYSNNSLIPIIGAEIEFYCLGYENLERVGEYNVKEEKGKCQYEINIEHSEVLLAIANISNCFRSLENNIDEYNIKLSPKPFVDDYGNALQLHINFLDNHGMNLFDNHLILSSCCDALCERMQESFLIFAPTEECYERFDQKFMSPTHVSKGFNNRSTAIRIPSIGEKRIEYRIGSYPADPYLMVYAILSQLKEVIIEKKIIKKYEFIYGNAYDEQYHLEMLPQNLRIAINSSQGLFQ